MLPAVRRAAAAAQRARAAATHVARHCPPRSLHTQQQPGVAGATAPPVVAPTGAAHRWRSAAAAEAVTVNVTDSGRFADVVLSSPQKHNALSPATMDGLIAAFGELKHNDDLRAVFLKADGPTFCAGGDLKHMRATADFTFEQNVADAVRLSSVFDAIATFRRPVVALVAGNTFGGGLGLLSACDMAFGVQGTKYAFTEVKLGVIPATISPYVVRRIGAAAARRYFLTAESFDADAATRIGLLHDTVDTPEALAGVEQRLKEQLALTSPAAVEACKALITAVDSRLGELADHEASRRLREWTAEELARVRDSADGREGMSAFNERRKPRWQQ